MTVLNLHAYPVKVSHTIHQGLYNSEHLRFVMPLIPTARAVVLSPDSKFGIVSYWYLNVYFLGVQTIYYALKPLRSLVFIRNATQLDIIIPDIIINHNGNAITYPLYPRAITIQQWSFTSKKNINNYPARTRLEENISHNYLVHALRKGT
jgi:hypothetical protein